MNTRLARYVALLGLALASLPLLAAGRPLAPRTLGPTAFVIPSSPQTAYAGGRFLTTWQESMGFLGSRFMGALSDANGARISSRAFRLDLPPALWYTVIGKDDSFVLFSHEGDGRTRMADIDLQGRVTAVRTVELPAYGPARFAWNGTHFLALLHVPGANNVVLAMFGENGQLVLPPASILGWTNAFDVAVADGRFVAVLSGQDAVFAHEVTPQGVGARMTVKFLGSAFSDSRPSQLIAEPLGNGDVLVILGGGIYQHAELTSVVLRRDGTRSDESLLVMHENVLTPVNAIRSGDGHVLVYSVAQSSAAPESLWTLRLDAAGRPAGEPVMVANGTYSGTSMLPSAASPSAVLVAYPAAAGFLPNIFTVAVAADGQGRAPELMSISLSRQWPPVLGGGDGELLAVWTEQTGPPAVRAASVDAGGEPRAAVQLAAPAYLGARETAWSGTHHLVVYVDGARLVATRVGPGGTPADAAPIVLAELPGVTYPDAAVVWAGVRWVVVWNEGEYSERLHSIAVSRDGVPSAPRTLDVHVPIPEEWIREVSRPTLAYDGERVLLVWSESQAADCWQLCFTPPAKTYAVRLTRSGAEYDHQPIDLEVLEPQRISAASSGSEFLVVADEHARVVTSGAALALASSRDLFGWPATSDVTWDGTNYVVALRYYGWFTDWFLGVLRLDRDGNDAAVRRGTATLVPDTNDAPSIAAPFAGNALIALHEGTIDDGVAAVVYRERDLAPLPPPPGAPRNVRIRVIAQWEAELTWDAPLDGEPAGYLVEQFQGGRWVIVTRAPGDARSANITYFGFPRVRIRALNAGGPSAAVELSGSGPSKRRAVR